MLTSWPRSSQVDVTQPSHWYNTLLAVSGEEDNSEMILQQLEDGPAQREVRPGVMVCLEDPGEYNSEEVKAQVMANVQTAVQKQQSLVS